MSTYHFWIPLLTTVFFVKNLSPLALRIGFTDKPSHRKQHRKHTPLIGGVAIYFSLLVSFFFSNNPFPSQPAFLVASTLLVCVGLIDDYKGLGVKVRILAQVITALIMVVFAHIKITYLGNVLGLGDITLGPYMATIFTIFAVVGGINAFNMIDGIDGLAGGLTLISIVSIAAVSWIFQDWMLFESCIFFIASILGFLLFNLRIFGRSTAEIFLGDTGSTLLGFTVCWLAINASQGEKSLIPPSSVLWLMALPLCDSVCIMLRRLKRGRSPFLPDREHLHHVFHVAGFSVNQTLGMILSLSLILSYIGLAAPLLFGIPDSLIFGAFILVFAIHYELMNHAWKMIKITRYLHITKLFDRRINNQKVEIDRRSKIDRRYVPTQQEIEKIDENKGVLKAVLIDRVFQKNRLNSLVIEKNIFTQQENQEGGTENRNDSEKL